MKHRDKQETEDRVQRALFPGFGSEEERREAADRLERYLSTLREWEGEAKEMREVPRRALN